MKADVRYLFDYIIRCDKKYYMHTSMSYILLYVTWNIFTISYMQSYISYIWVKAIVLC